MITALVVCFVLGYALALRYQLRGALLILLLLAATTLAGCASAPTLPRQVSVPVAVCPVPTVPPRPDLPVAALSKSSTPDQVARAYAQTVEVLAGYAKQLEELLKPFTDSAK